MKFPIGIQQFEKIKEEGYVYIDKTAYIHRLVNGGCYYFLSRPRRFGKSLLLSTIEAFFRGKKELFEGLYIYEHEKEWKEYPIFHLDFNAQKYDSEEALSDMLEEHLSQWEAEYGYDEKERGYARRFGGVIRRAFEKTGLKAVILVDEYDKPILEAYGKTTLLNSYRQNLKSFYGILKSFDKYIKFAMLTGVTKFGKISVFSDLNNLEDLSSLKDYSAVCGITDDELQNYFAKEVCMLADSCKKEVEVVYDTLKTNYGGYYFNWEGKEVYNPFSVLNTLKNKQFKDYWFETGTPTLLVRMLQSTKADLASLTRDDVATTVIDCVFDDDNPLPVIYQTGYLTISEYDQEFGTYKLAYPNREVKEGFLRFLLPYYTQQCRSSIFGVSNYIKDLREGNADGFMTRLKSLLSDIPYVLVNDADRERGYQNVVYILMKLMGYHVHAEYMTSNGRIDLYFETEKYVYLVEMKLNKSSEEAIRQIEDKGYHNPFEASGKQIIKIGVNFSSKTKTIDSWIVKYD